MKNNPWEDWNWRSYQGDCFVKVRDHFQNKNIDKQLIVQATGLGKRAQAIFLASKFKNSLFLAHSEELIDQAFEEFSERYGVLNVGIIKGNKMEIDKRFVIASPQTLIRRLDKIPADTFDLIQIDEAHRYLAKTFLQVVRHFSVRLRIGWTATPYRLDGLSLSNLFSKIVFEYNIKDGIDHKYLAEVKAVRIKTQVDLKGVRRKMGDLFQQELSNKVDIRVRNVLIVDSYLKYANGRQAIIFAVDIKHAQNIRDCFLERNIEARVLVSDTEVTADRKKTVNDFKDNIYPILINVMILTEGFDYSDVGCVIMARPTESLAMYMQAIGRGLRNKSKEFIEKFGNNCIILDIVDVTSKHSLVNTWELDRKKSAKEKVFVTSEEREKLFATERSREAKIDVIHEKDEYANLLTLPKVYVSRSPKMEEEATEGQIKFLKSLGIYDEEIEYTKGIASEYITNYEAQPWQKRKLLAWGYNPEGATIGQFQRIKNRMEDQVKHKIPNYDYENADQAPF